MSVLMIDLEATKLTDADIDRIKHPAVAGIIIFSRNFENKNQLKALIDEVRSKKENLLIAVDYEGGRVQRFRQQFTILPAMRDLGYAYEKDSQQALVMSKKIGWLISKELGSVDIDFSFTPVLDIDYASSSIIGDRAFHHNQAIISELANALIEGLSLGGMQGVGKHFPGHGFIKEDTHLETAVDRRELDQIIQQDVGVFKETIKKNLYGVMSAHVVYEKCDKRPSTFSNFWINDVLKNTLNFDGLVFSDDLSMKAAVNYSPSISTRVNEAFLAGIDIALICNSPQDVDRVLEEIKSENYEILIKKLKKMRLDKKKNKISTFEGQSLKMIQDEVSFFTNHYN